MIHSTTVTKTELPQVDGITVKEKIIRFFTKGIDRDNAEELYNAAEVAGFEGGTSAFDEAISLICKELQLDENELINQISPVN